MKPIHFQEFKILAKHTLNISDQQTFVEALCMAFNINLKFFEEYTLVQKFKYFHNDKYAEVAAINKFNSKQPYYILNIENYNVIIFKDWLEFEIPFEINPHWLISTLESQKLYQKEFYKTLMNGLKSIGVVEILICNEKVKIDIKHQYSDCLESSLTIGNHCVKVQL